MRTHVVPVPVQVALAAVAAGEGHTVGVNVQLTHWGAGRVKGLSPLPTAPPPSLRRLYQARPPQVLDTLPLPFLACRAGAPTSQTRGARFSSLPARPPAPASLGGQLENPQTCPPNRCPPPAHLLPSCLATARCGAPWAAEIRTWVRGADRRAAWRAQQYLRSGARGPPGPCGTRSRTCACRDPAGRSSGPQGPAGRGDPLSPGPTCRGPSSTSRSCPLNPRERPLPPTPPA